jgi:hypothetical protein
VLKDFREREELTRKQVAEHLTQRLDRPVAVQQVRELEEGAHPSQEALGALLDLYKVQGVDPELLFPLTAAAEDTRRAKAQQRAELSQRVANLGPDDVPVRFRGDKR